MFYLCAYFYENNAIYSEGLAEIGLAKSKLNLKRIKNICDINLILK